MSAKIPSLPTWEYTFNSDDNKSKYGMKNKTGIGYSFEQPSLHFSDQQIVDSAWRVVAKSVSERPFRCKEDNDFLKKRLGPVAAP